MAERLGVVKQESVAGSPSFDTEQEALDAAVQRAKGDDNIYVLVKVLAEIKRDPEPAVIVTTYA
jgi:hypothetical protein